MSWKTINQLLGRAMIDDHFARKLLTDPLRAAQEDGYDLSSEEKDILRDARASDIAELSQILLTRLKNEEGRDQ